MWCIFLTRRIRACCALRRPFDLMSMLTLRRRFSTWLNSQTDAAAAFGELEALCIDSNDFARHLKKRDARWRGSPHGDGGVLAQLQDETKRELYEWSIGSRDVSPRLRIIGDLSDEHADAETQRLDKLQILQAHYETTLPLTTDEYCQMFHIDGQNRILRLAFTFADRMAVQRPLRHSVASRLLFVYFCGLPDASVSDALLAIDEALCGGRRVLARRQTLARVADLIEFDFARLRNCEPSDLRVRYYCGDPFSSLEQLRRSVEKTPEIVYRDLSWLVDESRGWLDHNTGRVEKFRRAGMKVKVLCRPSDGFRPRLIARLISEALTRRGECAADASCSPQWPATTRLIAVACGPC
jgi:hypothetical protein